MDTLRLAIFKFGTILYGTVCLGLILLLAIPAAIGFLNFDTIGDRLEK